METPGTVTLLTRDTQHEIRFVIAVADWRDRLEICGMAFQTAWHNRTREIRKAVYIAGTVDPADVSPVGDWQFEQTTSFPEQVRLPLIS
jgi:hypothetical protein